MIGLAPEPSDIFFENLAIKGREKLKSRLLQAIITLIAWCVSFAAIFGLSEVTFDYEKEGGNYWLINLVAFVIAFVIVMVNWVLGRLIRY